MQEIRTLEDWQKLLEISKKESVLVFKHSLACPISAAAHEKLSKAEKENVFKTPARIIIVQNTRDISDQIEKDTGVKHESPQVIVLRNGKAVFFQSHASIDPEAIGGHLN